jgi:hypothetical protein
MIVLKINVKIVEVHPSVNIIRDEVVVLSVKVEAYVIMENLKVAVQNVMVRNYVNTKNERNIV